MKYKVGDRVKIKSLDWYNENKDNNREIKFKNGIFTTLKSTFLGQIMTIEEITLEKQYILMEDRYKTLWTDEMIEGLVEEEVSYDTESEWLKHEITLPEGYQFKDENGNVINATKIVLEKKKKEYPKTYEECCKVLDFCGEYFFTTYEEGMHLPENDNIVKIHQILKSTSVLTKLLICRAAYWKIAGEEMGLGKPWEPSGNEDCFVISRSCGEVFLFESAGGCEPFEFPTREMRDAFYENFKSEIEFCKELL